MCGKVPWAIYQVVWQGWFISVIAGILVDDKWENRSVVENLLQPIGFEVKEAINDFTSSPQSSRLS